MKREKERQRCFFQTKFDHWNDERGEQSRAEQNKIVKSWQHCKMKNGQQMKANFNAFLSA
jgi:hypothetical protein